MLSKVFPSQPSSSEDPIDLRRRNSNDTPVRNDNACEHLASEYAHLSESVDTSIKADLIGQFLNYFKDSNFSTKLFEKRYAFYYYTSLSDFLTKSLTKVYNRQLKLLMY